MEKSALSLDPTQFPVLDRIRASGVTASTPLTLETLTTLLDAGPLTGLTSLPAAALSHALSHTFPFILSQSTQLTSPLPQFPSDSQPVTLSLPRALVLRVLSAMVVGAVPHRGVTWPDPSFLPLLGDPAPHEVAKLRCFLEYFDRARVEGPPRGVVHFRRVVAEGVEVEGLAGCQATLAGFQVAGGGIEESVGALHADFANEYIGGGVLCGGCVQEEIRFAVCPENVVALALFERMGPGEAIVITGAEQFAATSGYMFGLTFAGPHRDQSTPRAPDGSVLVALTAIDAIRFPPSVTDRGQIFGDRGDCAPLLREIRKALAGFSDPGPGTECSASAYPSISTGNWGCGVFNGDLVTKAVIQWIAASLHGRDIIYHPFGDKRAEGLPAIIKKFKGKQVKDLFQALMSYRTCPHVSLTTHLLSDEN
jgi:hypothetical protein